MDGFGDSFVSQPEVDPAAEFLAREQNQLAGLEDELETTIPPPISSTNDLVDDFVGVYNLVDCYNIPNFIVKIII